MIRQHIASKKFQKNSYKEFILAADIGGTNTTTSIFGIGKKPEMIFSQAYESNKVSALHNCLNDTLKKADEDYGIHVKTASIACAGPLSVDRTKAKLTNLPWTVDKDELLKKTMLKKIILLNDFEAVGYGVASLDKMDEHQIVELHKTDGTTSAPEHGGVCGVIGAGTGLGTAILTYDHNKNLYIPLPSEGGHTDFAPANETEFRLMEYLKSKVTKGAHPDFEQVLSGQGMWNLYNFLRLTSPEDEITKLIDKLPDSEKPALITKHCTQSITCAKVIEMLVEFYARKAKNLALTIMARGGIYLGGGIAPRIIEHLKKPLFMRTFSSNRMSEILRKIPVYVVMDYYTGLLGCCNASIHHQLE